jgi:hypothetical protein
MQFGQSQVAIRVERLTVAHQAGSAKQTRTGIATSMTERRSGLSPYLFAGRVGHGHDCFECRSVEADRELRNLRRYVLPDVNHHNAQVIEKVNPLRRVA